MRNEHAPRTVRVPFAASSVAIARRELKAWMRAEGYSRTSIEDGRLVVSELVANSVRHAQPLSDGTILISWTVERRGIKLSVTDGGSESRPRKQPASTTAQSGRGLAIVEAIALEWWSEHTRSRSTIHTLLAAG